jgi:hypothetical protein
MSRSKTLVDSKCKPAVLPNKLCTVTYTILPKIFCTDFLFQQQSKLHQASFSAGFMDQILTSDSFQSKCPNTYLELKLFQGP